jgi:hypothetical protein
MRYYVILLNKTTEMLCVVFGISTLLLLSSKIVAFFLLGSLMLLADFNFMISGFPHFLLVHESAKIMSFWHHCSFLDH